MGKELGKYLPVARYWMRAPCRLANTGTGTARKKEKKAVQSYSRTGTVVYARLCMVQYCRYQYSAHMDIAYGSR